MYRCVFSSYVGRYGVVGASRSAVTALTCAMQNAHSMSAKESIPSSPAANGRPLCGSGTIGGGLPRGGFLGGARGSSSASSPAVDSTASAMTTKRMLGTPVARELVASALRVCPADLEQSRHAREVAFTSMELVRTMFAPLIASVDASTVSFHTLQYAVAKRFDGDSARLQPVSGALHKFTHTQWKSMLELLTFYEEVTYPIRMKAEELASHQLTSYHIKDVLKRGLTAFKQDYLNAQKEEMTKVQASMAACEAFMRAAVADALNTDVCNDMINILRVAGQRHEHAHSMALRILKDMNMMWIPYNAMTREVVKSLVFQDGPYDDSSLFFDIIESPERGEISLRDASLKTISDDMLQLMSRRHHTPLDADGALLHSTETHPNLQRSPE